MAKEKPEPKGQKKAPENDEHPDAWERFEHAVDHVMKAPPKHRTANKPPDAGGKKG